MNKARRTEIARLASIIDQVRAQLEDEIQSALESVKDEEQEYFDNMPESLQSGDKGQTAEAAVSSLETACDKVSEAIDALSEAFAECESAQG